LLLSCGSKTFFSVKNDILVVGAVVEPLTVLKDNGNLAYHWLLTVTKPAVCPQNAVCLLHSQNKQPLFS